ncbi:hypothetical protein H5410_032444 [Solanum commersonii]|uniref:Terpene synthase N-terminal domain-containing protein n=1 Tax=Solanum commersonii TaxID=4109 RepID=A0A9J5YL04_SOLCO|nr:hypothetical protein H5410_032444 [Solanum commersonii]
MKLKHPFKTFLMRLQQNDDNLHKFVDHDGKFKENLTNNVQGLLSLHEAVHLRVRGEEILEEAVTFTTTYLESMLSNWSNDSLKLQITETLSHPIHKTQQEWELGNTYPFTKTMMHVTICF